MNFCDTDIHKHAKTTESMANDKSDIIITIKDDEEIINRARDLYIETKMVTYFEMYANLNDIDKQSILMYNLFLDIWEKYLTRDEQQPWINYIYNTPSNTTIKKVWNMFKSMCSSIMKNLKLNLSCFKDKHI